MTLPGLLHEGRPAYLSTFVEAGLTAWRLSEEEHLIQVDTLRRNTFEFGEQRGSSSSSGVKKYAAQFDEVIEIVLPLGGGRISLNGEGFTAAGELPEGVVLEKGTLRLDTDAVFRSHELVLLVKVSEAPARF